MSTGHAISDIKIQDYFDIDGIAVNPMSIRAFDTGTTNKTLFRINSPITRGTPAQQAARKQSQDAILEQLGYLDKDGQSTLIDDPNTVIDESIAYMLYAGAGLWVSG
jgi:hypothetical protein